MQASGMSRRCHAHNRKGELCGNPVVRGKNVCRLHGGHLKGWRGQRSDDHLASMHRGRERWLVHRMERKAAGLPVVRIGRLPGRRKGEPVMESRARAAVMDKKKLLPVVSKPLAEMNHAEKLVHATGLALDEIINVFNLPQEPDA